VGGRKRSGVRYGGRDASYRGAHYRGLSTERYGAGLCRVGTQACWPDQQGDEQRTEDSSTPNRGNLISNGNPQNDLTGQAVLMPRAAVLIN